MINEIIEFEEEVMENRIMNKDEAEEYEQKHDVVENISMGN